MSTRAYILIETAVGLMRDVADALRTTPAVQSVDAVTGPYDLIAVVEAPDLNTIGELVTGRIHTIRGVNRTVTCLVIGESR